MADVCKVLEIEQPHHAAKRLDDDEKGRAKITTPGGLQEVTVISESGLYSVVMTSRKPEADVCKVLEIGNPSDAARRLDNDEKATLDNIEGAKINGLATGAALPTIINESGLYSLVLTSRKPEAKAFKRWITGTVIPALRKTGTYTVPTALPAPELPTIDLTDSALVLAIITAPATKAIEEGKRAGATWWSVFALAG